MARPRRVSKDLCEGGGPIVGVQAAGVGNDPGVAAGEGRVLEADAGVFDAGDDARFRQWRLAGLARRAGPKPGLRASGCRAGTSPFPTPISEWRRTSGPHPPSYLYPGNNPCADPDFG